MNKNEACFAIFENVQSRIPHFWEKIPESKKVVVPGFNIPTPKALGSVLWALGEVYPLPKHFGS